MTQAEVLKEIRKMPLSARRRLRDGLNDDLAATESNGNRSGETRFIDSMKEKGLILDVPNRMKGNISRKRFERVNVIGKPVSQTIIEDRG